LALGLLNVVVALGCEDRDYIEKQTLGWPAFKERILQYPPKRVAAITGIDEARIIELGTRLAHTRPTAIKAGQGVQRHAGGGMTIRVLASIAGVTGDWQRAGGGLMYSTDGYFGGDRDALYRDDLLKRPVRKLSMTRLGEGLLEVSDPPVMGLFIYGANPIASSPHQGKIKQGMMRDDLFTVVMEHFLTDTADYADIVLPATMQTEHADLHDGYGHLCIAWNEPAAIARGECLSTTETFRRLAKRMRLDESCLYDSDLMLASQLLDTEHPSLRGIGLEELRQKGWARLNYPEIFVPFITGFPTISGKLEFYSARAAADGHDPLPGFTPPAEVLNVSLAQIYPFVLISGASHYLLNSTFANNPELSRRAGQARILICPEDAASRNLVSGQALRIFNKRGSFVAEAHVSSEVRAGVLATTKGLWLKLSNNSNLNATVDERDADLGGGSVFGDNRVDVEPLSEIPSLMPTYEDKTASGASPIPTS
jgi:anaerobic selenocysteine-containing dehydrogenase